MKDRELIIVGGVGELSGADVAALGKLSHTTTLEPSQVLVHGSLARFTCHEEERREERSDEMRDER